MSKMGQAVLEGQLYAQKYYNVPRSEFVTAAKEYLWGPEYDAAVDAFDEINREFGEYLAEEGEELVPAIVEDGVPF